MPDIESIPLMAPQITESVLNNQSCFLEQPAWTEVVRSIIIDNPLVPERSEMVVALLIILISIPRLFRDVTNVIFSPVKPHFTTVAEVVRRARKVRSSLQAWYAVNIGTDESPDGGPVFCDGHSRVLVLFYICSIYSNRLNTCLFWTGTPYIEEIEGETQRYADNILALERQEAYSNLQGSLLLAQKIPMAKATIETGQEWRRILRCGNGKVPLFKMPSETFGRWCTLFGRKLS